MDESGPKFFPTPVAAAERLKELVEKYLLAGNQLPDVLKNCPIVDKGWYLKPGETFETLKHPPSAGFKPPEPTTLNTLVPEFEDEDVDWQILDDNLVNVDSDDDDFNAFNEGYQPKRSRYEFVPEKNSTSESFGPVSPVSDGQEEALETDIWPFDAKLN